ncbi:uncharacterized protein A1O9_05052 [Exophiala aquamarina CBS 119918]|uniref:Uncharacterized protein n=1 Tax=Exophiala aquamarina CBS 119918 TaxID=1182545 RepID=A0A072PKC1_9EURO|nr:uncharacterized protein A1O9_05052 [Exophiala aquamarina CBS 119918]KEF60202.1 hypothetical protein A1O9_05052 [Exophiala aquamarina CBS 119918]
MSEQYHTGQPTYPMYVVDPETRTMALPGRPSRPNKLEKLYRTACCGSAAGILLWILALLMVVFVPVGVILARNNSQSPSTQQTLPTSPSVVTMSVTLSAANVSPISTVTETTTEVTTETTTSISTLTSVITTVSVSLLTYSPPSTATVVVTSAVTTTNTATSVSTVTGSTTISTTISSTLTSTLTSMVTSNVSTKESKYLRIPSSSRMKVCSFFQFWSSLALHVVNMHNLRFNHHRKWDPARDPI